MAFARGKYAICICDRCGFQYKYLRMVMEHGTNLKVCSECNDGMWNRVDHPQNHPPLKLTDDVGLFNPRPFSESAYPTPGPYFDYYDWSDTGSEGHYVFEDGSTDILIVEVD